MAGKKSCIAVIPFGTSPKAVLETIAAVIPMHFGTPAQILPPIENPSHTFDPVRLQYNAAGIIKTLEAKALPAYWKVLGVLTVDLFLPVFTHVFGEAREGGKCAIVSLYRLNKDEGSSVSEGSAAERASKVALHELAHLFNVTHCTDRNCLMHFSMNLRELDEMPMEFCQYCRAFLAGKLKR